METAITARWACLGLCLAGLSSGCAKTWTCGPADFCVDGLPVQGLPASQQTDETKAIISRHISLALVHWGGDRHVLDGYRIVYVDGSIPQCTEPWKLCLGYTEEHDSTITLALSQEWVCGLEGTALPHEIGHVVIGDGDHQDRRWREFNPLWKTAMDESPKRICKMYDDASIYNYWNVDATQLVMGRTRKR
jgi:hypothetical protein